jgi:hypothetical protein
MRERFVRIQMVDSWDKLLCWGGIKKRKTIAGFVCGIIVPLAQPPANPSAQLHLAEFRVFIPGLQDTKL